MRLATYNLLHGMPVLGGVPQPTAEDRPFGPPTFTDSGPLRDSVAALDADVLGLQEVDVDQPRSGGHHQVRVAAETLDAEHWRFVPSVAGTPGEPGWTAAGDTHEHAANTQARTVAQQRRRADRHDAPAPEVRSIGPLYGVGLVSRRPVLEWRSTRFDPAPWSLPLLVPASPRPRWITVPDEPRVAVAAVVEGDHGICTVATAHLSFVPGYNIRQLRALRTWLAGMPRPLIVLGDFNLPGRLPARITGWTPLVRAATYPSMKPRAQLDHVLADGLSTGQLASVRSEVHLLPVSDHAAVSVDIDL
jgi:endonuclease/exonuclease/phosphatase family metal-dependent hydrolase